ncbi:hypothetical protein AB0H42_00410 [Nocardia sp. NPDC050799]|uniref:hypothetical protein n=1 Tax=Nocardia sp. NPDC050799 TaxID=3154842 RepID=UPI0033C5BB0B
MRDQALITKHEHPTEGEYYATRTPFTMSRTPVSLKRHAPLLNADTAAVLADLGYSAQRIRDLTAAGVVATTAPETASA